MAAPPRVRVQRTVSPSGSGLGSLASRNGGSAEGPCAREGGAVGVRVMVFAKHKWRLRRGSVCERGWRRRDVYRSSPSADGGSAEGPCARENDAVEHRQWRLSRGPCARDNDAVEHRRASPSADGGSAEGSHVGKGVSSGGVYRASSSAGRRLRRGSAWEGGWRRRVWAGGLGLGATLPVRDVRPCVLLRENNGKEKDLGKS